MTDPTPVVDLIEAFRRSKTMFAAVQLGIFDGERPSGAAMDRLLEACVALGLLERTDNQFINTPVADEYLRSASPRTLSGYIRYSNTALYPLWGHLEDAVLEGGHRWKQTFGLEGGIFDHFFKTDQAKRDFLMGMHGFGMLSSPAVVAAFDLSGFQRFVDLGGATGHLALAAQTRYPNLKATLFDLPEVIAVVPGEVREKIELIPGDFFTGDLPPSDLYAIGRILHDWSEEKIHRLLKRIHEALAPGGALLIAERLLAPDRSGPIGAHMQSLNMLICTEGRERTLAEYTALLHQSGFEAVRGKITGAPLDAVLATRSTSESAASNL